MMKPRKEDISQLADQLLSSSLDEKHNFTIRLPMRTKTLRGRFVRWRKVMKE